jgi:hypothetical protein
VLYEMATGRRAFEGKSKTSLVAAILAGQPRPISELAVLVPPALEHVVRKCLEKEPDDRWQSAKDVASELRWIGEAGSQAGTPVAAMLRRRTRERLAWAVAAAAGTAAAVFAALWMAVPRHAARGPIEIVVPVSLRERPTLHLAPALSPDGTSVAYIGVAHEALAAMLTVRRLDDSRPLVIPETEGAGSPFWSPDGREVAYFAGGKLRAVAATGGRPRVLADASYGFGGAWSGEGIIVFSSRYGEGLRRVGASGGPVEAATDLDASRRESLHGWPVMLPGGKRFLFLSRTVPRETNRIEIASLATRERRLVKEADALAGYVAPWLLFVRAGALLAQRFDPERVALSGDERVVAQGLLYAEGWASAGTSVVGDVVAYPPYAPSGVAGFWYGPDGGSRGTAFEETDVD